MAGASLRQGAAEPGTVVPDSFYEYSDTRSRKRLWAISLFGNPSASRLTISSPKPVSLTELTGIFGIRSMANSAIRVYSEVIIWGEQNDSLR